MLELRLCQTVRFIYCLREKERKNSFTSVYKCFDLNLFIFIIEKNIMYGTIFYYLKRRLFNESKK